MRFIVDITPEFGETTYQMRLLIEEAIRDLGLSAIVYTEDYVDEHPKDK